MAYAHDYLGHDTGKLGFGLMRLPSLEDGSIDVAQVAQMADHFLAAGLTYFDTAYVYGSGASEEAFREAVAKRYPRDSYTIATKMNAWLGEPSREQVISQFEVSLQRCGVDYFDYYLLHAIQSNNRQIYDEYGLWDTVRGFKAKGLARHWGFSYHAGPDMLDELLTKNPDVDFIQLQLNYADWESPSVRSRENFEVAQAHGVPFVVMEPVKGGKLATPPATVREVLDAAPATCPGAGLSYPSWAIRFVASLPGCLTVLSGMSNLAQMDDNLSYMRDFTPLTDEEQDVVARARAAFDAIPQIRCTECRYCCEGCPQDIPIPSIFSAMNRKLAFGDEEGARKAYAAAVERAGAGADCCIACGQCEDACPQRLPIIDYLRDCAEALA